MFNASQQHLRLLYFLISCAGWNCSEKSGKEARGGSRMENLVPRCSPLIWWMELDNQPQALPLSHCVGGPGTRPSKAPQGERGAVSQAAADPIFAHMCAIAVGAHPLHGRAGEWLKRDYHTVGKQPFGWCTLEASDCLPHMVVLASTSRVAAL